MLKLVVMLTVAFIAGQAGANTLEGTYRNPHGVAMNGYQSKEACEADQGAWEEDALCLFDGSDDIFISKESDKYSIKVSTTFTNAHTCEFEGEAKPVSDFKLVAEVPTQKYNPESDSYESAVCKVTVRISRDGKWASSKANQNCQEFCGANATLEIKKAEKVY